MLKYVSILTILVPSAVLATESPGQIMGIEYAWPAFSSGNYNIAATIHVGNVNDIQGLYMLGMTTSVTNHQYTIGIASQTPGAPPAGNYAFFYFTGAKSCQIAVPGGANGCTTTAPQNYFAAMAYNWVANHVYTLHVELLSRDTIGDVLRGSVTDETSGLNSPIATMSTDDNTGRPSTSLIYESDKTQLIDCSHMQYTELGWSGISGNNGTLMAKLVPVTPNSNYASYTSGPCMNYINLQLCGNNAVTESGGSIVHQTQGTDTGNALHCAGDGNRSNNPNNQSPSANPPLSPDNGVTSTLPANSPHPPLIENANPSGRLAISGCNALSGDFFSSILLALGITKLASRRRSRKFIKT